MKKHDVGAIIFTCFVIGCSEIHGFPPEGLTGKPHPFGDCMIYQLGNTKNPFTDFQELHDGSQLAFYPMTNEEVMLYFEIHISDTVFRVTLEGTTFKLEKCSYSTRRCIVEDEGGLKHNDFIKTHEWNIVKVFITAQLLQIYVGSRMVKTMSMLDYPNRDKMTWLVRYKHEIKKDETSAKGASKGTKGGSAEYDITYVYLVQFKCKEFVPHDNNPKWRNESPTNTLEYFGSQGGLPERNDHPVNPIAPNHHKHEDETKYKYHHVTTEVYGEVWDGKPEYSKMSEDSYIGLVVGLVIGSLIVIVIAIVVYYVIKKKRTAAITEHSPLHDQKAVK